MVSHARGSGSVVSRALAQQRLGVPAVVFFVMAAAAPLTVVAGGATTGFAVTGVLGIPVAYLVVAAVLAVFTVGYVAMSRRIVNAGAFYTYITHGLGRVAGVAAAFVAVVAYTAMGAGLYGGLGAVAAGSMTEVFGVVAPWWVWALAGWVLVTVLGVLRIDLNGRVLAVLLVGEIAVAVVFAAVQLAHPFEGRLSLETLSPAHIGAVGFGAAAITALTGFVGFEATTVLSEETRDPQRTVPRATYLAVLIIGVLYAGCAWAMSVATGPANIVAASTAEGTDLIFTLVRPYVGAWLVTLGQLLFMTSLFAASVSFHNILTRYLFALGREGVLPRALATTSSRTRAPRTASLVVSAAGFAVIGLYAVKGWDPLIQLFFWVTVTGGLGVLILMTATSVAVGAYFTRHRFGATVVTRLIAPVTGAVALGVLLVLTVAQFDVLLGVAADAPLRWILPALYVAAAILGASWAGVLAGAKPQVYAGIGNAGRDPTTDRVTLAATVDGGAR